MIATPIMPGARVITDQEANAAHAVWLEAKARCVRRIRRAHWNFITAAEDGEAWEDGRVKVIISASVEQDGGLWVHLSVSRRDKNMPNYSDLTYCRNEFLGEDALCYQLFAPASEHMSPGTPLGVEVAHLWHTPDRRPTPDFTRGGAGL